MKGLEGVALLTVVVSIVTIAAAVAALVTQTWRRLLKPIILMTVDWHGAPERPGVPARPGVMERLQVNEESLDYIKSELSLDHGRSVKDTVIKIAEKVGADPSMAVVVMSPGLDSSTIPPGSMLVPPTPEP